MSRNLADLLPQVVTRVTKFLDKCREENISLIITSTYRSPEEQERLYAQGRTEPGKKVTNARAFQSWHNLRRAIDIVPIRNGKPVWGTTGKDLELWEKIGKIGESCELEWAGRWKKFKEFPHFQYTEGLTLEQARNDKDFKLFNPNLYTGHGVY